LFHEPERRINSKITPSSFPDGKFRARATAIVSGLQSPDFLIEIECKAVFEDEAFASASRPARPQSRNSRGYNDRRARHNQLAPKTLIGGSGARKPASIMPDA
jgi:hypothetical protein